MNVGVSAGEQAEPVSSSGTAGVAPTPNPVGYVEFVGRDRASGWVCDAAAPGRRLTVALELNGRIAAMAVADIYRQDLAVAGYGDGRAGFSIQLHAPLIGPGVKFRCLVPELSYAIPLGREAEYVLAEFEREAVTDLVVWELDEEFWASTPTEGRGAYPALSRDPRDLPPAQLMMEFESLGDNCEFGLVQRYAGAEPLGLLRFSWTEMGELLTVLDNRFDSLKTPEAVEIYVGENREYMVRLNPHGFQYHTDIGIDTVSAERLRASERRRVGFLVDKLIDDLQNGEKILVRKGEGCEAAAQAMRLLETTRRYGSNTLLWVVTADKDNEPGTVEVVGPNLLCGYISRFAPYDNAHDIVLSDWIDLCAGAYRLRKTAAPVGTRMAPEHQLAGNLIDDAETLAGKLWARQLQPRPLQDNPAVMTHGLTTQTDIYSGPIWVEEIDSSLNPGWIYTLSAWLYIPANFRGTSVRIACDAFPALFIHKSIADLSRRDRWQLVWVSTRLPRDVTTARLSLLVVGEAGDFVYSTSWKLEAGVVPTPSP